MKQCRWTHRPQASILLLWISRFARISTRYPVRMIAVLPYSSSIKEREKRRWGHNPKFKCTSINHLNSSFLSCNEDSFLCRLLETPIDISQEDSNTSVDQHTSHLPNGTRSAVSSTDESRRSSASLTSSVDTLHMKVFSVTHESLPVTSPLPPSMPSDPMGFSAMQINETPSCSSDDSRSMPKIIQVEENVTMCEEPRVDTSKITETFLWLIITVVEDEVMRRGGSCSRHRYFNV